MCQSFDEKRFQVPKPFTKHLKLLIIMLECSHCEWTFETFRLKTTIVKIMHS